jgi:hypothetical protein
MKNFDESLRRPDETRTQFPEKTANRPEGEVVSLEQHKSDMARAERSLIPTRQSEEMRAQWTAIQAAFVDEPRKAVQDADELVSSAIKQIAEGFRDQRDQLEKQWTKGSDVSTEDLRVSLQHYRTFFDRLLSL